MKKSVLPLLVAAALTLSGPVVAGFAIFQVSTSALPLGVSLTPIDGETLSGTTQTMNYFSRSGWNNAHNAGWDNPTFFPIVIFFTQINGSADVTRNKDIGINNFSSYFTGNSTVPNSLVAAQGMTMTLQLVPKSGSAPDPADAEAALVAAGTETIGWFGYDEPQNWSSSTQSDIVTTAQGTNSFNVAIPAGFQTGRFYGAVSFTNNQFGTAVPGTPGAPPTAATMYQTFTAADGNTRHVDLFNVDFYWNSAATSRIGSASSTLGFGDTSPTFRETQVITLQAPPYSTGSLTITGSLPIPDVQIGTAVTIMFGAVTLQGTITAFNRGLGTCTVNVTNSGGSNSGTISNAGIVFTATTDQIRRGSHYGDLVDALRPFQAIAPGIPAPQIQIIENGYPDAANNTFASGINPPQLNAAVWASINHGARGIEYFNNSLSGSFIFSIDNFANSFFQTIQSGPPANTTSIYDRAKSTNKLVQTLAAILNSPFAVGYVSATGDNLAGSTAALALPYVPASPSNNNVVGNYSMSVASQFEVMAKWYNGGTQTINGVTLTQNKFWVFAGYRGSQADTNIVANFTIKNTASPKVTRFYSDSVLATASSGGGTTTDITVSDTSQMSVFDVVHISGSNQASLNGNTSISAKTSTTITVPIAFPGAVTFPFGVIITEHDIPITGGTTFQDTFPTGNSIGIYRVN